MWAAGPQGGVRQAPDDPFPMELSPLHSSLHNGLFSVLLLPRAESVEGVGLGVGLAASLGSSGTPVILILP